MPDVNVASGERVPITIVVSRDGDSGTRTELSENLQNGGLTHTWSAGDELYLYDSNGADAGKVTLESGDGSAKGVFKGEVTATSGEYCLWYFGSRQSAAADADLAGYPYVTVSGGQVTLDLKAPKFESAADFSKVDVMSQKATINVNGNQATVAQTVTMQPHVALARFDLRNLPAGVTGTLKVYDTKAQTEGNINTKQVLSLSDGSVVRSEETEAYTFTDWSSDKDLYVAFVPYSSNLKFEYVYQVSESENVNGNNVTKKYDIKNVYSFAENQPLDAGIYYQSFTKHDGEESGIAKGIDVPMVVDDSDFPLNMGNWVLEDLDPLSVNTTPTWVTDNDMWLVNCLNQAHTGGFGTAITFKRNGFKNGVLTSTVQGNVMDQAMYFQWGRWLGYPFDAYRTDWSDNSDYFMYPNENQYLYGLNVNDTRLGYTADSGLAPAYGAHPMGANSSFTVKKANDWSIMYALTSSYAWTSTGDYVYANEECSWEDRSGNPCPDNYRIPTATELEYLIPSKVTKIVGSHAEIKVCRTIKYAVKWVVNTESEFPFVEIRSFITNEDNIKVNDERFDQCKKIARLYAYGFLESTIERYRNVGGYTNNPKVGLYWSSSSSSFIDDSVRTLIDFTYNPFSGKGGKALQLEFSGNTLTMKMNCLPRNWGCLILPIHDISKKSSTLTPMLPLRIYHANCPYW